MNNAGTYDHYSPRTARMQFAFRNVEMRVGTALQGR